MDLLKDTLYNITEQEQTPDDLKAISTNLSPELVLQAYPMGLFPWHQDEKYFYWFSPNSMPRRENGKYNLADLNHYHLTYYFTKNRVNIRV